MDMLTFKSGRSFIFLGFFSGGPLSFSFSWFRFNRRNCSWILRRSFRISSRCCSSNRANFRLAGGRGGGSQNTSFSSELMIYQVPFCQVNHCTKFIIPSKWTAIKSLSLHNYIAGLLHSILPFFILLKEWNSLQTKLKRKKKNQEKKII